MTMHNKHLIFCVFMLLGLAGCKSYDYSAIPKEGDPVTVFIHGTLFGAKHLVHWFDVPMGLHRVLDHKKRVMQSNIPYELFEKKPNLFPLASSYTFGWEGDLTFEARNAAAQELYQELKKIKGPKTVIGHSHGCNVALTLARIAQEHDDTEFCIDRLILLACPVQQVTKPLAQNKNIFKRIYALYSTADMIQVADPQGMYKDTKETNEKTPFFSERTFEPSEHILHARMLKYGHSIGHQDFLIKGFIKWLPDIVCLLDEHKATQGDTPVDVVVNIAQGGKGPHIEHDSRAQKYIPRSR